MNSIDDNELDMRAGEYVLGVLSADEQKEFERELGRNRKLAMLVGSWRDRLLSVMPAPIPVEPATDLWESIERDLPHRALAPKSGRFWDNLFLWRAGSLAGAVASLILAVRLLTLQPESTAPQYLAVLQAPEQGSHWLVEITANAVHLRPLGPVPENADKALQFWTKPEGAAAPTSLGLVSPNRSTTIPLHQLPALGTNQLFEVTLEPKGGSPIGRPTGPILAVGKSVRL